MTFIALTHGVSTRGLDTLEIVARIRKKANLTKEDEKILRDVCEFFEVDYDRLPRGS